MNKKIQFIALFFLLMGHYVSSALNAPVLHCVHVNTSGQVQISWTHSTDMSGFSKYIAYYSTDQITWHNFTEITMTDVLSAHHTTVDACGGAGNTIYYYRIDAVSNSGDAYPSNVVHTMTFTLTNLSNGLAILDWENPSNALLDTYSSRYDIYRKYAWNYDFVAIGSTSDLTYSDIIVTCGEEIAYRVVLSSLSPDLTGGSCRNTSCAKSDIFYDLTMPDMPILDSVSVNYNTNTICLGWTPPVGSPDVTAYIIYYYDENDFLVKLDTVYGYNTTYWEDTQRDASSVYRYRIAALDSCDNPSPSVAEQNSMVVSGMLDVCAKKVSLSWNAYTNMRDGLAGYRIYYSQDGGALQYAGEVNATTTNYDLTGLVANSTYKVIVRAFNNTGTVTASSAAFEFLFEATETNDFAYLKNVTVVDNSYIKVNALTSGDTLPFSYLYLYRSVGNSSNFELHSTKPYSGGAIYTMEDHDVDVNNNLYYYKVEIINECDASLATSNISHNILLNGEGTDAKINNLQWLSYGTWEDGVANYSVFRKLQVDTVFAKIDDLMPEAYMHFSDDVSELFEYGSDFTYYVVAVPYPGEFNSTGDVSVSNRITAKQNPTTYIPNAFNPAREFNPTFKPVNSFVDTKNYLFTIWSRNGQIVFQTKDPYLGWDGTHNGKDAPMGVYIYHLKYLYPDGTPFETKGMVTLVR